MSLPTAIVLDIDETLCYTTDDPSIFQHQRPFDSLLLRSRIYILDLIDKTDRTRLWGIKRPHLNEFLSFCFKNFDYVIVWSAGIKDYVEKMINILFTLEGHINPHFVFSRDHCYDNKGDLIKPLVHLYEFQKELKNVPLSNIVILDNKESNFTLNVENGLLIDDYMPKSVEEMLLDDKNLLYAKIHMSNRLKIML